MATGNIKAQLAAMAMEAVRSIGLNPNCVAIMATIGRKVAVVARLEVSSVKNIIRVLNINTNNIKLKPTGIKPPIQAAKPVLCAAAARDKPPPKSSKTPQGTPRSASFHSRRLSLLIFPLEVKNKVRPQIIAIPGSVSPSSPGISLILALATQRKAVNRKIASTLFSEVFIFPKSSLISTIVA